MSKDIFTEIYESLRLHALREYTVAELQAEIERRNMADVLDFPFEIYRDDYIKVLVLDEKGAGGAHHVYGCYRIEDNPTTCEPLTSFQEGPIQEVGVNGYTNEALLAIVGHRLECFQAGLFPSHYNVFARNGVNFAISALEQRTKERKDRGVEGRSQQ